MGFELFKENTTLIQLEDKEKTVESAKNLAKELIKNKEEVKKLIGYIDLTTLAGDDTKSHVEALVDKALAPVKNDSSLHCGAVCVYPARVKDVTNHLKKKNAKISVASVAGGFPSGQYLNKSKLIEIECAVEDGATEIDTVISRGEAIDGNWEFIFNELAEQKKACKFSHLKVILATGELQNDENIYKASWAAMLAGADFIKTSTGKETVNATLEVAFVMLQAIKKFHKLTGKKIGFKPAGGIKTIEEALGFVAIVRNILGDEWLTPNLFRIGASSLLDNVLKALEA